MATSIYSPLDTGRREIRLLVLEPRGWRGKLACKLITTSLDHDPVYEALSYTWVEPQLIRAIILNDHTATITRDLEYILREICLEEKERTVWVDQICINQADDIERGCWLIIWLGLPYDNAQMALELIMTLGDVEPDSEETPQILVDPRFPDVAPYFEALRKFFDRPWWKRTWIVQELALSQHQITVFCGQWSIPWFTIVRAAEMVEIHCLMTMSDNLVLQEIDTSSVTSLQRLHRHPDNKSLYHPRPSLLDLCTMLRSFKATDPRDKIFGFMGLATDLSGAPSFLPDYTRDVVQTYLEFNKFLLSEEKSLEFLRVACRRTDSELPSWSPDWRDPLYNSVLRPGYDSRIIGFTATNTSKSHAYLSTDLKTLIVHGFSTQKISHLGEALHHTRSAPLVPKDILVTVLQTWEQTAQTMASDPYPTGESQHEVFWRTLMGNSDAEGRNIPTDPDFSDASAFDVFVGRRGEFEEYDFLFTNEFVNKYTRPFAIPMMTATYDRRFFVTDQGYIGFAPIATKIGDDVCLLPGASVPIILRKLDSHYILVGECYCHGLMEGELFSRIQRDMIEAEEFHIK